MDYRLILKQEFTDRQLRNSRYSLRAFARDLGVTPSTMSEVLSGKSGLSLPVARRMALKLRLAPQDMDHFCALVEYNHAKSPARREQALSRIKAADNYQSLNKISLDRFQMIADWFHLAILELTKIAGFRGTLTWVARRLAIKETLVAEAVARLDKLGLIRQTEATFELVHENNAVPGGMPSGALREYYRQLAEKANRALATQELRERDFSSLILAMPTSRIPVAKRMLSDFLQKMDKEMQRDEPADGLFCLSLQLFRLDTPDQGTSAAPIVKPPEKHPRRR